MKCNSNVVVNVQYIPTGCIQLDKALGVGGIPEGRVIEIFGPESSGKTTLALTIISKAKKKYPNKNIMFIDAEHALDLKWAGNLGVNLDDLYVTQPDDAEQAIEIVEAAIKSEEFSMVVVDSVAALVPRAEIEGEITDANIGAQARLMSKALRKFTGMCKSTNTTIIFINQMRDKIGMFAGSGESTPGGRALKFYASVRIDIRRIGAIKDKDTHIGNKTKIKVVKNKVAPPFREAEFDIYFGVGGVYGVDTAASVFDEAVSCSIITQSGSWFNYGNVRVGLGKQAAIAFLKSNSDVCNEIGNKIISMSAEPNIISKTDDEDDAGFDEEEMETSNGKSTV